MPPNLLKLMTQNHCYVLKSFVKDLIREKKTFSKKLNYTVCGKSGFYGLIR